MQDLPKAVWSGEFNVAGVTVKCHTLENGSRVIEEESFIKLLARGHTGVGFVSEDTDFGRWLQGVDRPGNEEGTP